jgi:hypothetical protein
LTKLGVDSLEKVYTKIHEEIRKNPDRIAKKEKTAAKPLWTDARKTIVNTGKKDKDGKPVLYLKERRLTLKERKENIQKKIQRALKKGGK